MTKGELACTVGLPSEEIFGASGMKENKLTVIVAETWTGLR
jgi:hypothetical protein